MKALQTSRYYRSGTCNITPGCDQKANNPYIKQFLCLISANRAAKGDNSGGNRLGPYSGNSVLKDALNRECYTVLTVT